MASTRRLSDYPKEYAQLFLAPLKAYSRGETPEIKVTLETAAEAESFRSQLYAYRRALAEAEGVVQGFELAMLMAPLARMRLEHTSLVIYYEPKDLQYAKPSTANNSRG